MAALAPYEINLPHLLNALALVGRILGRGVSAELTTTRVRAYLVLQAPGVSPYPIPFPPLGERYSHSLMGAIMDDRGARAWLDELDRRVDAPAQAEGERRSA